MPKLHEILAVEKTVAAASNALIKDTIDKFGKDHFFRGEEKSLKMLDETLATKVEEDAARTSTQLTTTVPATLDFMFQVWGRAEDVLFTKNVSNTKALADIIYRGTVIHADVPVDELMGLESRLEYLRDNVLKRMPTVDASKAWKASPMNEHGVWVAPPELTTKTQKEMVPVVLAPATDKHPAQVKESTRDAVVGTFTRVQFSGAATAMQKSEVLLAVDDLIAAIKQARMRANSVEIEGGVIAHKIIDVLMAPFKT